MRRSTIVFVLLALFASVTFAAKFDINVEIKKEKVDDSLPESELPTDDLAEEESTQNKKPSPIHKRPIVPNGKEQNKPKPGNKKEEPEEVDVSQHGVANKIVNKIEKILSHPPRKGEKPEEPIKLEPDSVDPFFSLPTPAVVLRNKQKPLA